MISLSGNPAIRTRNLMPAVATQLSFAVVGLKDSNGHTVLIQLAF